MKHGSSQAQATLTTQYIFPLRNSTKDKFRPSQEFNLP